MVEVDVAYLSILAGTVLPILVGLVTRKVTHSGVKATVLALLSAATGLVSTAIEGGGLVTKESLIAAAVAWVTAVASYFGFWKPTGAAGRVQDKTANVGV